MPGTMAAPGDESEAFKNVQHNYTSNAQNTQQTSQQIVHKLVSDIFDKNMANQSSLQGGKKANPPTAAPLGSSALPSTSSSASLPPGLSAAASRGHGRGRGSRSIEPISIETSWRSRPPPTSTNYRGRGGRGGPPSSRGGYTSSPTSSTFISGRRGGRHTSYQPISTAYIHQEQPSASIGAPASTTRVDDDDVPPPGFSGSDCPPAGFTPNGTILDEGPPPGFEEDDAPPPGFENNHKHTNGRRGGSGGGGSFIGRGGRGGGGGRGGVGSGQFSVGVSGRGGRGGGRGSAIAIVSKTSPPGRGVKIIEVPRNRPASASSSYTNSRNIGADTRQLNCISSSPATAAPVMGLSSVPAATTTAMMTQESFTPALKTTGAQPPIFKEFKPSDQFTSFAANFVDDTSSALRQIAIGGVPTSAFGGGSGGGRPLVPALEQPAPLIPPIPSSAIQITPLYPQIGIKSIW